MLFPDGRWVVGPMRFDQASSILNLYMEGVRIKKLGGVGEILEARRGFNKMQARFDGDTWHTLQ